MNQSEANIVNQDKLIPDVEPSPNELQQMESLKNIVKRNVSTTSVSSTVETLESRNSVFKAFSIILLIIIASPIIISDLYFGFTDTSCVNDMPTGLEISMKLYLLVSGFVSLTSMIVYIACISSLSSIDENNSVNLCCVYFTAAIVQIFHIIWNILGAVVFWGTIYGEKKCDKNVSTYIFVSLIMKFIANLTAILMDNSSKKN
jgi:hypothetical protein